MSIADLFNKGGPLMYVLALLSIYGLAVILLKIYQFSRARVWDTSFIEPVLGALKEGRIPQARQWLAPLPGPVARIMRVTLECAENTNLSPKHREEEIERIGGADIRNMEAHMRGLEMVANVAPLVGLLGTVMGMVEAFAKLGAAGTRVDPALLAGGIWEALLTTVGGLFVAVPVLMSHYGLDAVIERTRATMKDVAVQILALEEALRPKEAPKVAKDLKEKVKKEKPKEVKDVEAKKEAELPLQTPPQAPALKLLNPASGQK